MSDLSKFNMLHLDGDQGIREWDSFLGRQSKPSLFATTAFLRPFLGAYRFFFVRMGTQIKAGVYARISPCGRRILADNLVIHNGPVFADNFVDSHANSRVNSAAFEVLSFIADYFGRNYDAVHFRFSPEIVDMRPFLWFNYGEKDLPKYGINIRYTTHLDLEPSCLEEDFGNNPMFKGLSESRRQEIRYAIKNQIRFETGLDYDRFLELYRSEASAYDSGIEETVSDMREICRSLAEGGQLKVSHVYSATGDIVASSVFGVHHHLAYYLYGATSKSSRERYSGSYLLWREFQDLFRNGIKAVDLEGVNSPQRGWFKLSFGGALVPYYEARLEKGS